tara:strand:- start:302 stop:808 length:507 start_codon:yes stop_codon:yes gene_type:complete
MLKWIGPTLIAVLLAGCNPVEQAKDSREAVDVFHERLNAGDDRAIWANAGEELREAIPREDFFRLLGTVRKSLGPVEETSQQNVNMRSNPQGTFTTLQMETHFERGRGVETFVFGGSGDSMRLVGYYINSPDMMADMVENYADGPEGESAGDSDTSVPKAIRIAPIEQ